MRKILIKNMKDIFDTLTEVQNLIEELKWELRNKETIKNVNDVINDSSLFQDEDDYLMKEFDLSKDEEQISKKILDDLDNDKNNGE